MAEKSLSIKEGLDPLFNPRSVAVIGATNQWSKWGFSTYMSMLDGYKGKLYPINNKEDNVLGHRTYKKITDIPDKEPVDLAVFVIPAESIPAVMEECVVKGVRAGVIISAGFAEIGEEGKKLQDKVLNIAREGNIRFIGPNCMGFWSASSNTRAFMFPLTVCDGPFAFVSQGGNVGAIVVQGAYSMGMGFHRYVSCGCTADIQIEDYIEHFGNDPAVEVILAYIEGLNDGQRFIEKVRCVSEKKPVIVLKPGKTEAASRAILSHSGAMAGSSEIYGSAFKEAGVIRVDTADDLLDVAIGFKTQPLPRGKNVGIITPGGSYGVMSADACASLDLNVIRLSEETINQFDKIFPPRWSHGNPVDPAGDRNFIAYLKAPELLLKLKELDSLIFMGFDSFSYFASMFASMNENFTKTFEQLIQSLYTLVPTGALEEGQDNNSWMGQVVEKVIEIFFSLFGTAEREEGEVFAGKLISIIKSGEASSDLTKKLHEVVTSSSEKNGDESGEAFVRVFNPLMQALILNWIEIYGKPVLTTTFLGSAQSVSDIGYYAYSSSEQAAKVIAKLIEYREYLERKNVENA